MAITTSGTAATGSITVSSAPSQAATYSGQNIIIPNTAAGIGDIVLVSGSTIKVMAGRTYNLAALGGAGAFNSTTNKFISGAMNGYTLLGVIYGWENGCAMVVAPTGAGQKWANTSTTNVDIGTIPNYLDFTTSRGRARNWVGTSDKVMNVTTYKAYVQNNSDGTKLHPTDVWLGANAPMSLTNFNSNLNDAKNIYKTYEAYLSQLKPMGRGSKGIFSQKYHIGRKYTEILATNTTHAYAPFSAAQYCWNYGAGNGKYWLPDMVELAILMRDETLDRVNVALGKCGSQIGGGSSLWSSVRRSGSSAWSYSGRGVSNAGHFVDGHHARPVTLLKL